MKKNLNNTKNQFTYNSHFREKCFLCLLPALSGFLVLYIVFFGVNLSNVLARSQALSQINDFKRDHAVTEEKYLSLIEDLGMQQAHEDYGLIELQNVYFANESAFALDYKELPNNVR